MACPIKIDIGNNQKGFKFMNEMITITEVAERVGVSSRTIMRWEAIGKVVKAKRDYRGRRVYDHDDVEELITFHDMLVKSQ